jgi:hypothetical protein
LEKSLSQIETSQITGVESQDFREEANSAEKKFIQAAAAYLQRLINEREKTKQN